MTSYQSDVAPLTLTRCFRPDRKLPIHGSISFHTFIFNSLFRATVMSSSSRHLQPCKTSSCDRLATLSLVGGRTLYYFVTTFPYKIKAAHCKKNIVLFFCPTDGCQFPKRTVHLRRFAWFFHRLR